MVKIKYFGYEINKLESDLGCGECLSSHTPKGFNGRAFKSVGGALRNICKHLGTAYHKDDWTFEKDIGEFGDGWVLHIIVDKKNKFANEKMIGEWKDGKRGLFDLLVNVHFEDVK